MPSNQSIIEVKKTIVVIGDLMWKSFDDRFGDILERLRSYRDLIQLEVSLALARGVNDANRIADAESRLAEEERLQAKKARERAEADATIAAETRDIIYQRQKGTALQLCKSQS